MVVVDFSTRHIVPIPANDGTSERASAKADIHEHRQFNGKAEKSSMEREQTQDLIALSEARTDTKFAQLQGSLDLLLAEVKSSRAASAAEIAKLSGDISSMKTDNVRTRSTVRTSAFALASLIVALASLGGMLLFNSFNTGVSLSKTIDDRLEKAEIQRANANAAGSTSAAD